MPHDSTNSSPPGETTNEWTPWIIGAGILLLLYWIGWLLVLIQLILWLTISVAGTICFVMLVLLAAERFSTKRECMADESEIEKELREMRARNAFNPDDGMTYAISGKPIPGPQDSVPHGTSRRSGIAAFSGGITVSALLCLFALPSTGAKSSTPEVVTPTPKPIPPVLQPKKVERVLVIIVPGTYGNEGFWTNSIDGNATFASEVRKGLTTRSEVYPFLWASSVFHPAREQAANNLALLIDRRAGEFDRVCLIGHSHGGNVALRAAGLCRTRIDQVICLSTPHAHLATQAPNGSIYPLPIYASRESVNNIRSILSIVPDRDKVPQVWSNELLTGLNENDAIHLTTKWREELGHPRLREDGFLARLFESGNILASNELNIPAARRVVIRTLIQDSLGVRPHQCVHSRRIGTLIGRMIANEPASATSDIDYLGALLQPSNEDSGEPIPEANWQSVVASNREAYAHCGWVLTEVEIELDRQTIQLANDAGGSLPDPFLVFTSTDGKTTYLTTGCANDTLRATWHPQFVLYNGASAGMFVRDMDVFGSDSLGKGRRLTTSPEPPKEFSVDLSQGVLWRTNLKWVRVHH